MVLGRVPIQSVGNLPTCWGEFHYLNSQSHESWPNTVQCSRRKLAVCSSEWCTSSCGSHSFLWYNYIVTFTFTLHIVNLLQCTQVPRNRTHLTQDQHITMSCVDWKDNPTCSFCSLWLQAGWLALLSWGSALPVTQHKADHTRLAMTYYKIYLLIAPSMTMTAKDTIIDTSLLMTTTHSNNTSWEHISLFINSSLKMTPASATPAVQGRPCATHMGLKLISATHIMDLASLQFLNPLIKLRHWSNLRDTTDSVTHPFDR